jgi:hypothetical protein
MKSRNRVHDVGNTTESPAQFSEQWDEQTACGNPDCAGRWLSLWKDRRRPIFERQWGCSAKCIRRLVTSAIRREAGDASMQSDERSHRHRMPLGLMLLELGWISPVQLNHALARQKREQTGQIGHWLIAECGVDKHLVTRGLAMQWGCPVLTTDGCDVQAMALAVPKVLMEAHGIVPLKITAGARLYVAFADRPDASVAFAMERMNGLKVESGIVDSAEWVNARDRLRACEGVSSVLDEADDSEDLVRKVSSTVVGLQPRASRLVRVHRFYWLRMWLEKGAMSIPEGGIPRTKEDVVDRLYILGRGQ